MRKSFTEYRTSQELPKVIRTYPSFTRQSFPNKLSYSSLFVGTKAPYPENFRYKIARSAKYIEFQGWGDEFPIFDDVADMLDKAEDDLERDIKQQGWDQHVRRIRTWTFETAHLVVKNDEGGDGVYHKELMEFLRGLGDFGRQYGFFTCRMTFYNNQFTVDKRAIAELSVYTGPRAVAATA
ncbi:MAG: hypothetical protein LQ343_000796 [Gyalolechia ehrenbergii]|nr:MAG: hypothetical protein LQ343_000796 [Gyalolechia ehrenbergii]